MPEWIVPALLVVLVLLVVWSALRRADDAPIRRLEAALRDELGRQAQASRGDLGTFQQVLLAQSGDVARTQNEQIDSFRGQLAATQAQTEAALRRFSASFAEPSAADAALDAMNQAKLTQLRSLQIVRATDFGVKALKKFGASLTTLNLAGCTLVTQSGLVAALANTHALTALNVSDIPQAGTALVRLAPQLTQLRELVMENCGAGNEAIEALGAHCARLELVSLNRTEKATSPAVAGALLQWRQLRTLRVANCSAMDDSLLATIAACLTGLRQLTLSDRSGVSSIEILYHMDELAELIVVQALSESLEPEPLRLFSAKAQEALLRNSRNRKLMISVVVAK